jgi:hypothetical protein
LAFLSYQVKLSPMVVGETRLFVGLLQDITELERLLTMNDLIFSYAMTGLMVVNAQGRYTGRRSAP